MSNIIDDQFRFEVDKLTALLGDGDSRGYAEVIVNAVVQLQAFVPAEGIVEADRCDERGLRLREWLLERGIDADALTAGYSAFEDSAEAELRESLRARRMQGKSVGEAIRAWNKEPDHS